LWPGKDIVILQNLLIRSYNVTTEVAATGLYDKQTAQAVGEYKKANLMMRYFTSCMVNVITPLQLPKVKMFLSAMVFVIT
jgi:hypothetical protein